MKSVPQSIPSLLKPFVEAGTLEKVDMKIPEKKGTQKGYKLSTPKPWLIPYSMMSNFAARYHINNNKNLKWVESLTEDNFEII